MNDPSALPFDFRKRRSVKREELRASSSAGVTASVVAFCDWAAASSPDFDELMMVGLLAQENPAGCDAAVVEWLAAEVTAVRCDVACAFLYGLWDSNPRIPPPAPAVVARLASLRPTGRFEPDADYSYALAMSRVIQERRATPEAVAIASRELELACVRGTGDSALDQNLFALRARHLPKRGADRSEFQAYAVTGQARCFSLSSSRRRMKRHSKYSK